MIQAKNKKLEKWSIDERPLSNFLYKNCARTRLTYNAQIFGLFLFLKNSLKARSSSGDVSTAELLINKSALCNLLKFILVFILNAFIQK